MMNKQPNIKEHMKATLTCNVKESRMHKGGFRGVITCYENGQKLWTWYSEIVRVNRADALADARKERMEFLKENGITA